jgi:hypothetical protein
MPIFTPFVYREPLLAGEAGTAQTVAHMRELVDQALRDPALIRFATDLVRGAPAYDDAAEAQAIYDWVRGHIRFTKDPVGKEKLYPPAELLKIRAGDCDDISMLLATLVMAVGYPARLVTVSANGSAPDQFSHVYIEAEVQGQWIPLDAARPEAIFGSEPPMYYRKRAWSLTDDSYEDLSGRGRSRSRQRGFFPKPALQPALHLGVYPRFRSLGQYDGFFSDGGDGGDGGDGDGIASEIASIIPVATKGAATILQAAGGRDPWVSFRSPYTQFSPPAGYSAPRPVAVAAPFSLAGIGMGTLALIALGAYLAFGRGK